MPKPCCTECNDICRPGQCGSQCSCTKPCNCTTVTKTSMEEGSDDPGNQRPSEQAGSKSDS